MTKAIDVRLKWGLAGAKALLGDADVFVIVDVLSFSTAVDVAVGRGARVAPFPDRDREAARQAATRIGAVCAERRDAPGAKFSLSPPTLENLRRGETLLLPSPNGSAISAALAGKRVFAGCLRNAAAIASAVRALAAGPVAVVPAGEHWPDGAYRPALEDWLGAGAILAALTDDRPAELSPEAEAARTAFHAARPTLGATIRTCRSGLELIGRGFLEDVECALACDASGVAPRLVDGAYAEG